MSQESLLPIPILVNQRVTSYKSLWILFVSLHYAVGILGLFASILASYIQSPVNRVFALVAALCFGVIAFVKPEQQYYKYVRAWRLVDNGVMKYRLGLENQQGLMQQIDEAEKILYDFEDKQLKIGTDQT